jgi:hypothetical protein
MSSGTLDLESPSLVPSVVAGLLLSFISGDESSIPPSFGVESSLGVVCYPTVSPVGELAQRLLQWLDILFAVSPAALPQICLCEKDLVSCSCSP